MAAQIVYKENTADDPSRRRPDITKAKSLLGWQPRVALRDGLVPMVEDFRKRLRISEQIALERTRSEANSAEKSAWPEATNGGA